MNAQMALLSNQFVYAAMGVYTLAFITFAVSLAATKGAPAATAAAKLGAGVPVAVGGRAGAVDGAGEVHPADIDDAEVAVAGGAVKADRRALQAPGRRSANIGMSLTWVSTALLLAGVPPEKSPSTVSSVAAAMARAWSLSCQAAAWGAWQVAQVAEPTKPAASH